MKLTNDLLDHFNHSDLEKVRELLSIKETADNHSTVLLELGRIDDAEEVSYDAMVAMHKLRILANAHKEVSSWTRSRLKA